MNKGISIIKMEDRIAVKSNFSSPSNLEPPYTTEQWLPYKGRIIHFSVVVPEEGDAVFYLDGIEIDIKNASSL